MILYDEVGAVCMEDIFHLRGAVCDTWHIYLLVASVEGFMYVVHVPCDFTVHLPWVTYDWYVHGV